MNLADGDTSTTMSEGAARAGDVPALVELAKQGDDEAFGILVDEYKGKIYNYVSRMLHDPTEAEDVAQEVFIRAYENLMGFRGAASFQTWLYRIASNLAIDAARARNRRDVGAFSLDRPVATDDGQLERELPTGERGPDGQVESTELQEIVAEALTELSPKLRMVISLFDIEGLSYREIADVLGCPVGTVKSRLFNARNQLRQILASRIDIEDLRTE